MKSEKSVGAVNRAVKCDAILYCDWVCSGLARQMHKPMDQQVAEKCLYDMEYRRKNREILKVKKRAYFEKVYDPVKAAEERRLKMPSHVEYCRQPEYKARKRENDKVYRAKQETEEYWESYLLTMEIQREVFSRMSWYEIHLENGTLNKHQ